MVKKLTKTLGKVALELYRHLGGSSYDEKDFQKAMGYEFSKLNIEYLRETHIELYYKDIPIKLGAPDFFLNKTNPAVIIELKLGSSLANINRQQLRMYLSSIKKDSNSILSKVKSGYLINFLKDEPQFIVESESRAKKNKQFKVEVEYFSLDKNDRLVLLDALYLEAVQ